MPLKPTFNLQPEETTMPKPLPADPENMNAARAGWAAVVLRQFRRITGTEDDDALGDLLCDLMHWCDRNRCNFDAALSRAQMHYEAETTPEL
jgi:hypothetical protein